MSSCEYCESFNNTYLEEHLRTASSVTNLIWFPTSGQCQSKAKYMTRRKQTIKSISYVNASIEAFIWPTSSSSTSKSSQIELNKFTIITFVWDLCSLHGLHSTFQHVSRKTNLFIYLFNLYLTLTIQNIHAIDLKTAGVYR